MITPFLMFQGQAEEAMTFYTSLFPDSRILSLARYGARGPGPEGSVQHAVFSLAGQTFMCIDSVVQHPFSFTPSMSLQVVCESAEQVEHLFGQLADGGLVLMPLDTYPFARRYAWVNDRFGVSWQLLLRG